MLRAVLRHLERFEPRELVVTGGAGAAEAGAAEAGAVFRVAGLMGVVREEGATFFDHNRPPIWGTRPGRTSRGPRSR